MSEPYHAHRSFRSSKVTNVSDQEDILHALGIPRLDPDEAPELYAELYRIARRVREAERTVVGLLPTGPTVAVAPMAVVLGFALADACEGAVAVVDANTRWPVLTDLKTPKDEKSKKSGFRTTWLANFLAVMTPMEAQAQTTVGMRLEGLDHLLRYETRGFMHMLLDLTGFEVAGEHWGMLEALDGLLLVGHPGVTHERDLMRLHDDIPAGKVLGVVLVG